MKHTSRVESTNKFFFAGQIVYRPCKEGWLAVSVESANWLVLHSDFQKQVLQRLVEGQTVGDVFAMVKTDLQRRELMQLLAAVIARDFARTDSAPEIHYLEGYKVLNVYLTNACNLRCKHCFMHSGVPLHNELKKDEWLRILSEFHEEGGEAVTFSGGEPLMNVDFAEIVKHAYREGLMVTVLTNGTLWSIDKITMLAPYINEVQVSLDGVDEMTNSMVRGAGHFSKILETIISFANNGVRTSVATTFTFDNLQTDTARRYIQLVDTIKKQCKSSVFFKLSKKVLNGRNIHYTEAQNQAFYQRILEIEKAIEPYAQLNNFMEGHTPNLVARNCGFGGISVAADGEIFFCNRISEVESYGNIRGKAIKDYMSIGHQLHLQTGVERLSPCQDCYLRYICCGGCRIDECNFHGKLTHFQDDIRQVKCTDGMIMRLEQKMVDGFMYYYKF